jgi:hypothetical protein
MRGLFPLAEKINKWNLTIYFFELSKESSELISGKRKRWFTRRTMNGTADVNKAPGGKGPKNGFPSWRSCIAL